MDGSKRSWEIRKENSLKYKHIKENFINIKIKLISMMYSK